MADEKSISDEQVDQLNNYEPVKLARTLFIKKATEYVKAPTPELKLAVETAEEEYRAVFAERLRDVIENPPQPKSIPHTPRFNGFK